MSFDTEEDDRDENEAEERERLFFECMEIAEELEPIRGVLTWEERRQLQWVFLNKRPSPYKAQLMGIIPVGRASGDIEEWRDTLYAMKREAEYRESRR